MCGRYTLSVPLSNLVDSFDVLPPEFEYLPRFNIAPTQDAPVIAEDDNGRRMGLLRWGLIPSWAKEKAIGNRMINARAETVAEKPAFRSAFQRRRCLVPADGFFEWKKVEGGEGAKGSKVPFWIHREGRTPFAMAGLWEKWKPGDGSPVFSFTILTIEAVPEIRGIHPRMPVILPAGVYDRWLDPEATQADLQALLRPNGEGLQAYPVSPIVNSPRNDTPECIEPA
ncbi:MAG: SOS response-associated peptidase [Gemmatimonadetes bacterium]|nr:SOS response-associated peptidase [Gemmatimonadota bacterium]NNM06371.1 SOS response-associated peptidase [Gemmatimonadota bacterium]